MRRFFQLPLPVQVMIGMALGILFGALIHHFLDQDQVRTLLVIRCLEVGGELFINMFRVAVIPVVLISMILGTAAINPAQLGRVGIKTLCWFTGTTLVASVLGLVCAWNFRIGEGVAVPAQAAGEVKLTGSIHSFSQIVSTLVPANVFQSFLEENMVQVIVVAIVCGLAVAQIREQAPHLVALLEELDKFNMVVIGFILKLAPLGVFCLLSCTFSHFGFAMLLPLGKYILCFLAVSAMVLFVIYPLLLICVKMSPLGFYRWMFPVMLLAFSTSSSNAVLPSNIQTVSGRLGVPKDIATFVLSLGATINMNGTAVMQGCAAILIAQLYSVQLTVMQVCEIIATSVIAAIGTAGVPSAGVLMLGLVLQSVGLPLSGIALVLGVDRIVDMFRTVVNITGSSVTAVLVSSSEGCLDRSALHKHPASAA